MRARLWLLLAPVALVVLLALVLGGWWQRVRLPPAAGAATVTGTPRVAVTTTAAAVVVEAVGNDGRALPAGTPVRLTLATPAGPTVTWAETDGGPLRLEVPFSRAGRIPYRLSVGDVAVEGVLERRPGPPITPVDLHLGARAARITGDRDPALVLFPLDAQDNVSDLPVAIEARYPRGETWRTRVEVRHLLAWTMIPVGARVGTLAVSAVSGGAHGERGEVDLLPGPVVDATFVAVVDEALASGRDVWRLDLREARDARGNLVGDGTAIAFAGGGGGLDVFLTRPLIMGGQPLILPSVPVAGEYSLYARAERYRSDPVTVTATPPVLAAELPARWRPASPPVLELGPVMDAGGALVDDGTRVALVVHAASGPLLAFDAALEDGRLRWTAPPLPARAEAVVVEIAGRRFRVPLPPGDGR